MCCILKRPDLHICAAEQREKCVSADSLQRILKLQSQRRSLSLSLSLCLTIGNPSRERVRGHEALPSARPSPGGACLTISCSLGGRPARASLLEGQTETSANVSVNACGDERTSEQIVGWTSMAGEGKKNKKNK